MAIIAPFNGIFRMDQLLALRAFVRIAEAGSFAKAADSMNLPRSSVSKLLQDLEAHLQTKLVERTTRAVTVTAEGARYHQRAVRLLADLDDMDSTLADLRTAPKGRLRVDIGSAIANLILIPALPAFQALYPDIEVQLGVSDRPADLIEEGIDCVIRGGAMNDSALIARRLCALDWVTCAAPAYLEGRSLPARPSDLEEHRLIAYFSAASGRSFPLRYRQDGQEANVFPQSGLSVNESTAHLTALLAGLGIGQTFGFMARPHLRSGALVELLLPWKPADNTVHLVYPASRFPNQKLRVFADWAAGIFSAYDRRGG